MVQDYPLVYTYSLLKQELVRLLIKLESVPGTSR